MGIKGKATSLLEEFKAFALKGNIVDMAIGVIIGGAFGKIVTSFVNDIVMPCVNAIVASLGAEGAGEGLKALTYTTAAGAQIPYGAFIGNIVDFLIVAIVVFIVMKKFLGFVLNMRKKEEEKPAEPPAPPEPSAEEKLLTEIRDLLKK